MYKVKFDTGEVVSFQNEPTDKDIEDVVQKLGIKPKSASVPQGSIQPGKKPVSFLQGRIEERGKNILESINLQAQGKQGFGQAALQTLGQGAGLVGDVLGKGITEVGKALLPKSAEEAIASGVSKISQSEPVQSIAEKYSAWRAQNPSIARDLEATVNIASLFPAEKVVSGALKPILGATGELATKAGSALEKSIAKTSLEDVLKVVRKSPEVMSKTEKVSALAKGKAKQTFLKGIEITPEARDLEIAQAVQGIVDPSKKAVENIDSLRQFIKQSSNNLKQATLANDAIFNTGEFKNFLGKSKAESKVIFGGEKALEKNYDAVIDLMASELNKQGGNKISNVLEARKSFDRIIEEKFPNLFEKFNTDNVRANAVRDVRRAANDFVASKLPEGDPMKAVLKQESLAFEAIDNIALNNVAKINQGVLDRATDFIKAHPYATVAASSGLSAGLVTGILTSPVALGAILTYGSYQVGKKIVTSEALQSALANFLKTSGKVLNPENKTLIQDLIKSINEIHNDNRGVINPGEIMKSLKSSSSLELESALEDATKQMKLAEQSGNKTKINNVQKRIDSLRKEIVNQRVKEKGFTKGAVPETALLQEARGKSLDEFLEAQGDTSYRGEGGSNGNGNYFTKDKEFASEFAGIKPLTEVKIPESSIYRPSVLPEAVNESQVTKAIKEAKSNGYKAVYVDEGTPFGEPIESIFVFDKSVIKTKSQLTEIWQKANKKK